MIKIALRPNLIYPIYLIIWTFLRKIISILLSELFHFKGSLIYTILMFFGEILGGLFIFKYQKNFFGDNNSQKKKAIHKKYALIQKNSKMKAKDGFIEIYFLIFMTGFFDFFEFILSTYYIGKINKISSTLQIRLGSVLIVVSSLLYWCLLKFDLFRHHFFSMIIIGVLILLLILSEYFFQKFDGIITYKDLTNAIVFSVLSHMSMAFNNTIEKYLIEFDFINPFIILFRQGIIGLIFSIILAIVANPFKDLKDVFDNNSGGMITLFIFLLLLYTFFGALKNIYRMFTIMLFTPMNKHLADFIINPIYIIYYFSFGEDFIKDKEKNYFYFFTNLILLFVFDICGLIFNEFIILFCCGLEHNTYKTIARRASEIDELTNMSSEDEMTKLDDSK